MWTSPLFPEPWRITPKEHEVFVDATFLANYDFRHTAPQEQDIKANDFCAPANATHTENEMANAPTCNAVQGNSTEAWSFVGGGKFKDKFGLVATEKGAHLAFEIKLSQGFIFFGALGTQDSGGVANVFLSDSATIEEEFIGFCRGLVAPIKSGICCSLNLPRNSKL